MSKLLHVAFGFDGASPGIKAIQEVFGVAGWARYAPNCWIVATNESPKSLAERLRRICSEHDSIYIAELNINGDAGYLQKEIWDWLRKYR